MIRRQKWICGVGLLMLILSLMVALYFDWSFERTIQSFSTNAKTCVMNGYATIMLAENELQNGHKAGASSIAHEGIGWLEGGGAGLYVVGIRGVEGMSMVLDRAISSQFGPVPGGTTKSTEEHYQHIIQVFLDSFKPLSKMGYAEIGNQQLQKAIDQVYQAMTPEERQLYSGGM
ncbi:hypothetical protein CEB3_c01090 [Peptococcaceae bacterium CEB3]|nr:hypothetical protein CEB3_c01090 [Peptococcaceae bacterium CEB3]